MYTDRKQNILLRLVLIVIAIAVCAVILFAAFGPGGDSMREEGAAAIRDTIERTARQCYVVEGIYPPDLEYLEEHYGIQINHKDYYVTYEAFASNLPPTVRVAYKPE